jgi:ATP-dependent DNA ligase
MTSTNIHKSDFVFPGETFSHVHRFPTIIKDGVKNKLKWTIYCGVMKEVCNNKLITTLNGRSDDEIIEGFSAYSSPILPEYFNHNEINYVAYTVVDSHQLNSEGSRFLSMSFVNKGKNLAKVNKTNAFTQAMSDALSKYNKHLDFKYFELMLAKGSAIPSGSSKETLETLVGEKYYIQNKYDGIRMAALVENDNVITYSRGGKPIKIQQDMKDELLDILSKVQRSIMTPENHTAYLDGELYKHGVPLSEISGKARSDCSGLEYWVYDIFFVKNGNASDLKFGVREKYLRQIEKKINVVTIKFAPTLLKGIGQVDELERIYEESLSQSYEGLIMRLDKPYNNTNRNSMIKLKELFTEEFRVVDFTEGVGKMEKTIMYTCELTSKSISSAKKYLKSKNKGAFIDDKGVKNRTFSVTPNGSLEDRKNMFKMMHRYEDDGKKHFDTYYKNRLYTVQFNNWSNYLVPMCPVGISFREF